MAPLDRMMFRFPEATRRDPAIDAWLDAQEPALGALARGWFARLRACGEDVRELMHDRHPTACVGDAPFAEVNVFTAHVNLGFFHGATLADPDRLLAGSGRFMRHVKLRPGQLPDEGALERLIDAAYADIRARLQQG